MTGCSLPPSPSRIITVTAPSGMQLDSICPGDPLLDCETLDPERALFFWL